MSELVRESTTRTGIGRTATIEVLMPASIAWNPKVANNSTQYRRQWDAYIATK